MACPPEKIKFIIDWLVLRIALLRVPHPLHPYQDAAFQITQAST